MLGPQAGPQYWGLVSQQISSSTGHTTFKDTEDQKSFFVSIHKFICQHYKHHTSLFRPTSTQKEPPRPKEYESKLPGRGLTGIQVPVAQSHLPYNWMLPLKGSSPGIGSYEVKD